MFLKAGISKHSKYIYIYIYIYIHIISLKLRYIQTKDANESNIKVVGRLRVKSRKRVPGFLRVFTRKHMHFFVWGLLVLRIKRNLRLFTHQYLKMHKLSKTNK